MRGNKIDLSILEQHEETWIVARATTSKTKSQTVMDQVRERMMKNNHGRQLVVHTRGNQ